MDSEGIDPYSTNLGDHYPLMVDISVNPGKYGLPRIDDSELFRSHLALFVSERWSEYDPAVARASTFISMLARGTVGRYLEDRLQPKHRIGRGARAVLFNKTAIDNEITNLACRLDYGNEDEINNIPFLYMLSSTELNNLRRRYSSLDASRFLVLRRYDISEEIYFEVTDKIRSFRSLDAPDLNGVTLMDSLTTPDNPETICAYKELLDSIKTAVFESISEMSMEGSRGEDRERNMQIFKRISLSEYYGNDHETLEEVSREFDITRERTRQINEKILREFKKKLAAKLKCFGSYRELMNNLED